MKNKTIAILLGLLFIPLGFLYIYKRNVGNFWYSLVIFGLPIILFSTVNYDVMVIWVYLILHIIAVYRLFISQPDSFFNYYPSLDYNKFDFK